MEDRTLSWCAAGVFMAGMAMLAVLFLSSDIPQGDVAYLTDGQTVRITGRVSQVRQAGDLALITIVQEHEITAAMRPSTALDVHPGDTVEISGTVSEYRGEKQLEAEMIIVE